MNRRVCVWIGSLVGAAVVGGSATAASAATLVVPPAVVAAQSAPAISPSAMAAIDTFVKAQLADLQGNDPGRQRDAHKLMLAACPRPNANLPTTAYYDAYAKSLSTQAMPLLSATASSLRFKVATGVVVEQVAAIGPSAQSIPVVQQLLNDPSPAVALWGTKAAKPLVQLLIGRTGGPGTGATLFKALVDTVEAHKASDFDGFIADGAYSALLVDPSAVTALAALPPARAADLLKPLYDPVLDLLAVRTKHYDTRVVLQPDAEARVPSFLSRNYATLPKAQQERSFQALLNLVAAAGQRAPLIRTTDPATLKALRLTVINSAQALNVMFSIVVGRPQSAPLANVTGLVLAAPADQIAAQTAKAYAEVTAAVQVQSFVKAPPPLPTIAPPPPPATPIKPPTPNAGGPAPGGAMPPPTGG